MIILIGGIKGGGGKTTIAVNLACFLASQNHEVLLVDSDDQATATDFTELRNRNHPGLPVYTQIKLHGDAVLTEIRKIASKRFYDYIVIDSGGRDTSSQRAALAICNAAIVPFNPRAFDVWTIGKMVSLAEEMSMFNPELKLYAVLNKADATGSSNELAEEQILSHGKFLMIPKFLVQRKAYALAASSGLSVLEIEPRDLKAYNEFTQFATYVENLKDDDKTG